MKAAFKLNLSGSRFHCQRIKRSSQCPLRTSYVGCKSSLSCPLLRRFGNLWIFSGFILRSGQRDTYKPTTISLLLPEKDFQMTGFNSNIFFSFIGITDESCNDNGPALLIRATQFSMKENIFADGECQRAWEAEVLPPPPKAPSAKHKQSIK